MAPPQPAGVSAALRCRRWKSVGGGRAHTFVDDPLEAAPVEVFAHVEVAFAIDTLLQKQRSGRL